jgi:putative hydrolase of the HAD superfamily
MKVVLFDLDDTLFAHRESLRVGFAAHLSMQRDLAVVDVDAEVDRWVHLEEEHYPRYLSGELDWLEQRRQRSHAFLAPYGVTLPDDAAADAWFGGYRARYRDAWALHDDVIPCLDALVGLRFGVITNGEFDPQADKIATLGLGDRIEHLVASGSVGVAKPHAAIFELACDLFGVVPADACYVGDRFETDAVGAAAAGLRGVWIDRRGAATPVELERAATNGISVISSLVELPALSR